MKLTKIIIAVAMLLAVQSANIFAQQDSGKCVSGNCSNGYGKFIYADGDIYEGDFVNNKREGKGTYTAKNGDVTVGQFVNHQIVRGKYTYPDGENYEGGFVNGKVGGQGTYSFKNGEVYVGQFANGTSNGKGKYTYLDGESYEGYFVNGFREGQGTYQNKDGSYYIGEFEFDCKNGYGKEYDKSKKLVREGTWKNDVFVNPNSAAVTAKPLPGAECVSGDCVNGKGKFKTDFFTYEGDFVNGVRIGQGTFTYASGDVYSGQFVGNKFNGKGKLSLFSLGDTYEGDFVKGRFEGQGTYQYKDGSYYIGRFKMNKRDGFGKEFNKSKKLVRDGRWKNDVFMRAILTIR